MDMGYQYEETLMAYEQCGNKTVENLIAWIENDRKSSNRGPQRPTRDAIDAELNQRAPKRRQPERREPKRAEVRKRSNLAQAGRDILGQGGVPSRTGIRPRVSRDREVPKGTSKTGERTRTTRRVTKGKISRLLGI